MAEDFSLEDIAEELKKEKLRTTILNLKLLLLEYNLITNRLRSPDYRDIALKNLKKIGKEIESAEWPHEVKEQVTDISSQLGNLAKYIQAEDFIRFFPVHNRVKRSFETLEEKFADWAKK